MPVFFFGLLPGSEPAFFMFLREHHFYIIRLVFKKKNYNTNNSKSIHDLFIANN